MDKAVLSDIHRYWFGDLAGADDYPADKAEIWFKQNDATDAHIARSFGPWLKPAAATLWDGEALSREQRLGLVVLLDQFPRNIFRTSGEAFAYDGLARRYADRFLGEGGAKAYHLIERVFLYLPFEHSESTLDQERSIRLYEELLREAPEAQQKTYATMLDFAVKHRDLIDRFGRFPHRNAVLGRISTPEEDAFLKQHGRGY